MSLANLQLAVRNELRAKLQLSQPALFPPAKVDNIIELSADGQPFPDSGQLFLGIHGTSWAPTGAEKEQGIEESFAIAITITQKTSATPVDRQTERHYTSATLGLDFIARLLTPLIHQSFIILNAANTLLGDPPYGFQETLRFAGADAEPTERGPDWFWASPERQSSLPTAWSLQTRFAGALRIQELSAMT